MRRRVATGLSLAAIASVVLAGCAEGGDTSSTDDGSVDGETVSISGGITGSEADLLQQSFDQLTEDTGIKVVYTGDKGFEGNIVTKVAGGDAPDIAIVPQPGLLKALVETGEVKPGPDAVSSNVDEYWSKDWKTYGTIDDTFYAAPMLANVKGYVWYSPKSFAEWGVEVPTTWDELITLTTRSGRRPASRRGARASSRARRPGGRERTGSKTSCSATRDLMSTTSGSRTRSSSPMPRSRRRSTTSARSSRTRTT